ncbi:F-box/kelch-repeat protein At3g06240-like [Rutidosis leptorrhynchoides]|uniref:F-box/kelch-repeat protein At3g06240-like n=1 Tax=Rutidosis leptorrhynchoides TaxID=125765 RepID=UPI003A98E478
MSESSNQMRALNQLPTDLIESTLPLLPSKSLGRFKSVSKRWNSLISSPDFIKTHILNYTKNNPNLNPTHLILVLDDFESLYSLEIKQLNTLTTVTAKSLNLQVPLVRILGSCNGLLLYSDMDDNLCLVNPITPKTLKIPESGRESNDNLYGFGYDSSTDDYKVISISHMSVSNSDQHSSFVCVYSLRNNSWNMLLPNLPYYVHYPERSGVPLLNNNLHWLVTRRRSRRTIAAFSLAEEEFHEIGLPDSINFVRWMFSKLCALNGKLVVVLSANSYPPGPEYINELWVMEEYGVHESWKIRCILEDNMDYDFDFFAQVSNRDILLVKSDVPKISISKYDMDETRFTSVTVEVEGCQEEFVVGGTFVETLESFERFR